MTGTIASRQTSPSPNASRGAPSRTVSDTSGEPLALAILVRVADGSVQKGFGRVVPVPMRATESERPLIAVVAGRASQN
ncbi:hypothetical protein JCM30237_17630 [Halolamina litorea]